MSLLDLRSILSHCHWIAPELSYLRFPIHIWLDSDRWCLLPRWCWGIFWHIVCTWKWEESIKNGKRMEKLYKLLEKWWVDWLSSGCCYVTSCLRRRCCDGVLRKDMCTKYLIWKIYGQMKQKTTTCLFPISISCIVLLSSLFCSSTTACCWQLAFSNCWHEPSAPSWYKQH